MDKEYLISIISPIYNAERYLSETIESIIRQTIGFENLELILIDDKSTDGTRKVIESYASKYKNIKTIYHEKNSGYPGVGRNNGLDIATAEYIMFIDADDEYEIDACEKLYTTITENDCDLVRFRYERVDSFTKNNPDKNNNPIKMTHLDPKEDIYDIGALVWDKIFKKSIIDEKNIRFVTDRVGEDSFFCLEYCINSGTVIFLDNYYGYKYFDRDGSFSTPDLTWNLNLIDHYEYIFNIFKKYNVEINVNNRFDGAINYMIYSSILMTDNDWKSISELLNKLYLFEKKVGFNNKYKKGFFYRFLNYFIINHHFTIPTFILFILNRIHNIPSFVNIYRWILNKIRKNNI